MLDFPATPTVGQIYQRWRWDGAKWQSYTTPVPSGGISFVSDTPPPNPRLGDLWFDGVSAQLFVWVDDGTSKQWVVAVNAGSGAATDGVRLIKNADPTSPPGPGTAFLYVRDDASAPGSAELVIQAGTSTVVVPIKGGIGSGF